jgi:hypothetical protein
MCTEIHLDTYNFFSIIPSQPDYGKLEVNLHSCDKKDLAVPTERM